MSDPDVFLSGANAWEQGNYPLAAYLGEQGIRSKTESVPSYRIREACIRSQSFIEGQSLLDALKDRLFYYQDFEPVETLFISLQKRLPLCKQTESLRSFYQDVSSWFQTLNQFDPEEGNWHEIQKACCQILAYFPLQTKSKELLEISQQAILWNQFIEILLDLKLRTESVNEYGILLQFPIIIAKAASNLPPLNPLIKGKWLQVKELQEGIMVVIIRQIFSESERLQEYGLYEKAEKCMESLIVAIENADWPTSKHLAQKIETIRNRKNQFNTLHEHFIQMEQSHQFSECETILIQCLTMAPKHAESLEAQKRVNDKLKQAQTFRQECEKLKAEKNQNTLRSRLLQEGIHLLPVDEYKTWLAWAEEGKRKKRQRRLAAGVLFLMLSTGVTIFYVQVLRPFWDQVTAAVSSPNPDRAVPAESPRTGSNFDAIRLEPADEIAPGGTLRVYLDRTQTRENVILEARLLPGGTWKPESNGLIVFSNISNRYGNERTVEIRITQVDTGVYQVNSYPLLIRE